MAWNVTTEWFDQQVKHGNYLPQEKDPTRDEIEKMIHEEIEKYDPMEHKNLEELKVLEEDDDEDEFIKQYKQKRMQEMLEYSKKAKYGKVREIRKQDYIKEVNEASKECFVVLLLHQDHIESSRVLDKILENLAMKFPTVKFLRIQATNCVHNFRDEDVPTIFIYKDGEVFRKFLPAPYYFGGSKMTADKVEWIFGSLGIIKSTLLDDPFDEQGHFVNIKKDKVKRDDESDDEEREERQNRWKIIKK